MPGHARRNSGWRFGERRVEEHSVKRRNHHNHIKRGLEGGLVPTWKELASIHKAQLCADAAPPDRPDSCSDKDPWSRCSLRPSPPCAETPVAPALSSRPSSISSWSRSSKIRACAGTPSSQLWRTLSPRTFRISTRVFSWAVSVTSTVAEKRSKPSSGRVLGSGTNSM